MSRKDQENTGSANGQTDGSGTSFARDAIERAKVEIQRGQLVEAEKIIRRVVAAESDNLLANHLLGAVLLERGCFAEAKVFLKKALEIDPEYSKVRMKLGVAEFSLVEFDRAEASFRAVITEDAEDEKAHFHLAQTLGAMGRDDEAVNEFRRAIDLWPEFSDAWSSLGRQYQIMGRMDEAAECLEKALDINPKHSGAWLLLARTDYFLKRPEKVKMLEDLYEKGAMPDDSRSNLAFALGRIFEARKEFDAAFDYFSNGNKYRRYTPRFSIKLEKEHFRKLRDVFSREFIERHSVNRVADLTPLFVLGMPRSGTTLVEQILSSHPDVHGAGELVILGKLCMALDALTGEEFPGGVDRLDAEKFFELGARYLSDLRKESDVAKFVTDKLPHNFKYIGMILIALPNAKIINCRRDPMDNCFSIYRNNFFQQGGFGVSQKEIGQHYRLYEELMAHWHHVAPGAIHDIVYEDLVSDTETEVRRLLTYCDLNFDPACLAFDENRRPVRTMSNAQVRRPIYSDSISGWKRYERHLDPLKEAVGYKAQG